jgi:isohexenylglutaconyl-CoA hydratase
LADTLALHRAGDVLHVTLSRPEARNAMSRRMVGELLEALSEAERDGTRVIVLRGAGGHFCAGGDIRDMAAARGAEIDDVDPIAELNAEFGRLALAWSRTPVVTVAVVEGAVMGGGFGLACTVDVVLASTTAVFRLPETSLGVVPAQIAPFLIERLGWSEARRLAVTGGKLGAAEALTLRLVHEVHDPGDLDAAVASTVRGIRRCAPQATAATKRLLQRLHPGVDDAAIRHAADVFAAAARGPEAVEGMTAFFEKRAPSWAAEDA